MRESHVVGGGVRDELGRRRQARHGDQQAKAEPQSLQDKKDTEAQPGTNPGQGQGGQQANAEAKEGSECGLKVDSSVPILEGDILEAFNKELKRKEEKDVMKEWKVSYGVSLVCGCLREFLLILNEYF